MKTRPHSARCANIRLSEDLTETFREKILALRPSAKTDWLKAEFFTKFISDETDSPSLRRERAIEKWLQTENRNAQTYERLNNTHPAYHILPRVTFQEFVRFCQDVVIDIIGETVPTDALIGSFSGGASTSRPRTESHPAFKYLGKAHATERALQLFVDIVDEVPGWINRTGQLLIETVPGNVMFTVPKKTDIDRVACKEPDVNMWLQKGVGSFIRSRLKRTGINLNDQSINSSLARLGSLTGELATIDLSSASDSVSTALVELLLPVNWYTLLDTIRCQETVIPRGDFVEVHRNEMFSSMGNGFTFELESLLFYALARTAAYFSGISGIISVYGDDIICPSALYDNLEWVLKYFGFQLNAEKSFSKGPFRESCGGHYYNAVDITPFYIRKPITHLLDVIHTANSLRAWAGRTKELTILDPEVEDIWLWLKSFVPECLWGGSDTSNKFQLVSPDLTSHVLREETKKRTTGTGGYLLWLNATMGRTISTDGVQTSFRSETLNRFRLRKVRIPTVTQLPQVFFTEI